MLVQPDTLAMKDCPVGEVWEPVEGGLWTKVYDLPWKETKWKTKRITTLERREVILELFVRLQAVPNIRRVKNSERKGRNEEHRTFTDGYLTIQETGALNSNFKSWGFPLKVAKTIGGVYRLFIKVSSTSAT
jgi:hypothetical protein